MSQKLRNILVTWGKIRQLWVLLLRPWNCLITLDCVMPTSANILQVLLARFTALASSTLSESTALGLLDLAWSSRHLQSERNFLKHLVTVHWSTALSLLTQQIFSIASAVLWLCSNSLSITSRIRRFCTFICVAFKSYTVWINVQRVSAPTTLIKLTPTSTYHGLNRFGHEIYILQTSSY